MPVSDWVTPTTVILAMAAATMAVRFAGYWIMASVPLTPFVRAALEALPGTIIIATIVPLAMREGLDAWLGIAAAAGVMIVTRKDIAALVAGLAVVAGARLFGL